MTRSKAYKYKPASELTPAEIVPLYEDLRTKYYQKYSDRHKRWRDANKEKWASNHKRWREANPEKWEESKRRSRERQKLKGMTTMTASELKFQHESKNPESHFFDRDTMRFFGDTMRNFGVRSGTSTWILYTKQPTKAGSREYHFDKVTFKKVTL